MKLSVIESRIESMVDSEYFSKEDIIFLKKEITQFIRNLDNHFGDNDGERLDTDSMNFIKTFLELRMLEHFGEYEDA